MKFKPQGQNICKIRLQVYFTFYVYPQINSSCDCTQWNIKSEIVFTYLNLPLEIYCLYVIFIVYAY